MQQHTFVCEQGLRKRLLYPQSSLLYNLCRRSKTITTDNPSKVVSAGRHTGLCSINLDTSGILAMTVSASAQSETGCFVIKWAELGNCPKGSTRAHLDASGQNTFQVALDAVCFVEMPLGRLVPWSSWDEWERVRAGLFSTDTAQLRRALNQVSGIWRLVKQVKLVDDTYTQLVLGKLRC